MSHLPPCGQDECLVEAMALLALWYGRWQGFVVGTPEEMALRTAKLLERHGYELRKIKVQREGE